jgi:hypothetical protein
MRIEDRRHLSMSLLGCRIAIIAAAACIVCGCAQGEAHTAPRPLVTEAMGPPTGSDGGDGAVVALASADSELPQERTAPGRGGKTHRSLEEFQCQCLAAEKAWLANLTEWEGACSEDSDPRGVQATHRAVLCCRVVEQRNRAAGEALEAYYRLAEVEAQWDLLGSSIDEAKKSVRALQLLKARGLNIELDDGRLDRQLLELEAERSQLDLPREQLNGQLRVLLDADVCEGTPFWPEVELSHEAVELDVEEEIATGLSMRPDLAAVRIMLCRLDRQVLSEARSLMQAADSGLGASAPLGFLRRRRKREAQTDCELRMRRAQLEQLLEFREKAAVEEIRQAVHSIEAEDQAIALATRKAASLRRRKAQLKEKLAAGVLRHFGGGAGDSEGGQRPCAA